LPPTYEPSTHLPKLKLKIMSKLNYEFNVRNVYSTKQRHRRQIELLNARTKDYKISDNFDRWSITESFESRMPYQYWLENVLESHKEDRTQSTLKALKSCLNLFTRELIGKELDYIGVPKYLSTALYITNYKYINHEMKQALKYLVK